MKPRASLPGLLSIAALTAVLLVVAPGLRSWANEPVVEPHEAAAGFAAADSAIAMGQKDLPGGATKLGDMTPGSISTHEGKAIGVVCNKTGLGVADLGFELIKGAAASVSVYNNDTGELIGSAAFAGRAADFNFPAGASINNHTCVKYKLEGVTADGVDLVGLYCTPSVKSSLDGVVDFDVLPALELEEVINLRRSGVPRLFNQGFAAIVHNGDSSNRIHLVEGMIEVPGNPNAELRAIQLLDSVGSPVANASATIDGSSFQIAGFSPLPAGSSFRLIAALDADSVGELVRLDVEASFAP